MDIVCQYRWLSLEQIMFPTVKQRLHTIKMMLCISGDMRSVPKFIIRNGNPNVNRPEITKVIAIDPWESMLGVDLGMGVDWRSFK